MSQTHNSQEISSYIASKKVDVDRELHHIITTIKPANYLNTGSEDVIKYALTMGGKRVRPILAMAVYEACGGQSNSDILRASCVPELVHAASLMLDDLPCMDNALSRRGHRVSHALFGESSTILLSAGLWVKAFEILSSIKTTDTAQLIHKMSMDIGSAGLIHGQLLDLAAFNSTQNIDELEECYRLKTGTLFSLSASIGAVLAGADEPTVRSMENFAEYLGIAYQIRDDIIDSGDKAIMTGKDIDQDTKNNKPNYVSILGYDGAVEALSKMKHKALSELSDVNTNILEPLASKLIDV